MTTSLHVAKVFGKSHKHVLRDIENILSQLPGNTAEPKFGLSEYLDSTGRKLPMYRMDRDAFSFLVMGYTGSKATHFKLAYIRRFNEMEKELRVAIPNFSDPVIAARAWADQVEAARNAEALALAERECAEMMEVKARHLEQLIEEDRPKVALAESITSSKSTILVGELAKILKQANIIDTGQNRLFDYLRRHGYLHIIGRRRNEPTQRSLAAGWMVVKEGTRADRKGETRLTLTPKITGKGQEYFINHFLQKRGAGTEHGSSDAEWPITEKLH
jgi:anti-repressor protein